MKRDWKQGGERFAIPTQGEIEGKLVVLEVVAVACLREILASGNTLAVAKLKRRIREALKAQCLPLELTADDRMSVNEYALEVFKAAKEEAAEVQGLRSDEKSDG